MTSPLTRWRLVLGRFAQDSLPDGLDARQARMDQVLDFLYSREYSRRGVRSGSSREGGDGDSVLAIPEWLREVRELFPTSVCETLTSHALDRYGMTELVTDPKTLKTLEPNYDLLKALLTFKSVMKGEALDLARVLIAKAVEQLREKLAKELVTKLWGRIAPPRRTRRRVARNLDFRSTIRANLKHYDPDRKVLVAESLIFRSRVQHQVSWHIIICVDCSGSMVDSVIYSAVMSAIFAGIRSVRVSLVAFDTQVVDLSEHASDPAAILMSVQLGGGTDIAGAMGYCATLVTHPSKTIVVLVTDFFENGPITPLVTRIRQFKSEGVRVLGLASLDSKAAPNYDRDAAEQCAKAGADVGAMTPDHLAEWVGRIIHQ